MPNTRTANTIANQLIRCGTSVGANYRAACRGVSAADVISKLGDVEEEADETLYWLEMLVDADLVTEDRLASLTKEVNEILAMTAASIRTMRSRHKSKTKK